MSSAPDPFLLLLAALLSAPIAIAVCLRAPAMVTLGFVTILCVFSSSTWGQLQEENTIYARGTGIFAFSLLNLLLWTAAAAMLIRTKTQGSIIKTQGLSLQSPFPLFLTAFSFMLLGHLVLGLMSGIEAMAVFGYNGIINVLNMTLFALLILSTINSEQHRRQLLLWLLGLAALRAAFGLVRYQFLGGDTANPYRNFEKLDLKLVYFDIADNYIAALAAFCIAWLLLMPGVRMSLHKRALLLGLLAMEIATVALSFRRSSLVGLGLMFAVLLWQLPWQRRILCGGVGIAALAAFCIAWLLLMPGVRMSLHKRALLLGLFAMEVATVALSFRRSSLVGLGLMFAVLLWQLPWQRRILCGGVGIAALMIGAATLMRERLQFNTQRTGFLSSLFYDVGPGRATEVSRFYELEAAAKSLDGQWLFGLGSWGTFYGNEDALDYHFGKFDFVHSGFGHLVLKSGLVGLLMFLALLSACVLHYFRYRAAMRGNSALLADMSMAGLLFWSPTLLIGTPIIEFRSMLLIGMTLAMVYLHPQLVRSRNSYLPQPYAAA